MANTILLKGDFCRKEGKVAAGQTIKPGHLLDRNSSGELIVHAGAGAKGSKLFAVENDLAGKGIDDAYAAADQIQYHAAKPGDEIYALLKTGNNVTPASYLVSAGDGTMQLLAAEVADETLICRPMESINNASGSAVRIKVEVL